MLNYLKNETNVAFTENGARAYATTKSAVLDFFANGGAMRSRSEGDVVSLFSKAFGENPLLSMKALFYFRDIRGGQGERKTFRTIVKYLANHHTVVMGKNIQLIPFYGRWDDVYQLFGTTLENRAGELIKEQFEKDVVSENPSLLGKWLKSENASSFETKKLAKRTRELLGLSPKEYRKALSSLRKKINIVESTMTEKRWEDIEYDKLPSQAGLKYRQAFFRNDEERYREFLSAVTKGEKKINAKDLFPYEIVRKVQESWYGYTPNADEDAPLNAMWENLPNYFGENRENSMAVVDTSGSMSGEPMEVAVSLGLYIAERNFGAYHNHFITFSKNPQLVEVQGSTFCERVRNIKRADWGMNTDVEKVFDLILKTAVNNKLPQEEMVKRVYIISDMQFDSAKTNRNDKALFSAIREKYQTAGYGMPELVFWNVRASSANNFPMTMDDNGTILVSGNSPSIFQALLKNEFVNPYELMLGVLNSERYEQVTA